MNQLCNRFFVLVKPSKILPCLQTRLNSHRKHFPMKTFLTGYNFKNEVESVYVPTNHREFDLKSSSIDSLPKYKLNKYLESCIHEGKIPEVENVLERRNIEIVNSGVLTFLLNFYLNVGEIDKAVELFEKMKDAGKIKHNRLHARLIVSLCHAHQIQKAFQIFQDYVKLEFLVKTTRVKKPDQNILIALLRGIQLLLLPSSPEHTQKYHKTKDIPSHQVGTSEYPPVDMIESIMNYMSNRNLILETGVLDCFHTLLKTYDVSVTKSQLCSNENRCSNCNSSLKSERKSFNAFAESYISNLESVLEQQGFAKDLYILKKYFRNNEYFDVIVDCGNLLYRGTKNDKIFTPLRLKNCLKSIINENRFTRIALILPQSFHRSSKMKELAFLHDFALQNVYDSNMSLVSCKSLHDDIVFLYVSAKCELINKSDIRMISNDQFLNHSHVLNADLKGDWLNWCMTRRLETDINGNLVYKQHLLPIQKCYSKIHIIDKKSNVLCIDSHSFAGKIK